MAPTDVFILNVGSGSCAVVSHPSERRSMIDINNGGTLRSYEAEALLAEAGAGLRGAMSKSQYEAALTDPIAWYRRVFGDDLWRFILSHPDLDHMSGIRHMFDGTIRPTVFWDLQHSKHPETDPSKYPNEQALQDAIAYFGFHADYQPQDRQWNPQKIAPHRFEVANYWGPDGIEVLSPSPQLLSTCNNSGDWNNLSYVLRFNHAGRSVLLPGDIEQDGWDDLAAACAAAGVSLHADVLVASHHGRKSGFPGNGVLEAIAPEAVIVSAAKIPAKDDAIPDYRRAVGQVFSTRQEGTLGIRIFDNGELSIYKGAETFEHLEPLHTSQLRNAA